MTYFDDKLAELLEKISHRDKIEAKVNNLDSQRVEIAKKVWELEKVTANEEKDVEKYEQTSISNLFLKLLDKMDEKLEKERAEAFAARMKYITAQKELRDIEDDIYKLRLELKDIDRMKDEYEKTLNEKAKAVREMGGELGEKIMKLEEQYTALESHKKELDEAIVAGNRVLMIANQITDSLEKAEKWGKWDAYGGGGTMSDVAKHSHLDKAQIDVTRLQYELRNFSTELADVRINDNIYVSIDGFNRYADYFFDGIFVDFSILRKISNSINEVEGTKSQIRTALNRLHSMYNSATQQQNRLKSERDQLVSTISI